MRAPNPSYKDKTFKYKIWLSNGSIVLVHAKSPRLAWDLAERLYQIDVNYMRCVS